MCSPSIIILNEFNNSKQNKTKPNRFPAHPHRGFTTLTYFLPNDDNADSASTSNTSTSGGGFIHRDSLGIKQTYGSKGGRYTDEAQWLFVRTTLLIKLYYIFLSTTMCADARSFNERYHLFFFFFSHSLHCSMYYSYVFATYQKDRIGDVA